MSGHAIGERCALRTSAKNTACLQVHVIGRISSPQMKEMSGGMRNVRIRSTLGIYLGYQRNSPIGIPPAGRLWRHRRTAGFRPLATVKAPSTSHRQISRGLLGTSLPPPIGRKTQRELRRFDSSNDYIIEKNTIFSGERHYIIYTKS